MRKNITGQVITAQLISTSDGSNVTTGTTNVFVTKDGGTQSAGGGAVTHEGNGLWSYSLTQAETDANHVVVTFVNTSAVTVSLQAYTISFDPHNVASLGLTNLDTTVSSRSNFNPASDTVARVTLVDTTTANTDMRGTDNALLSSGYTAPDNASIADILADTNELQSNQGNWLTATGFSTHSAADVWSVATRALTDKSGFSISGTITTLDGLNNFDPASDTVSNVTNLTNLPSAPINWLTASSVASGALNGKGDWNIGKTGYSLTQAFPNNFSSMLIDGSGRTKSLVQGFLSTPLVETTHGRIAGNFDTFFENGNAVTSKTVDDVGTAISGGGEFTTTEKNQIRFRLGMDGTTTVPTASPDLAQKSDIASLNDFDPATDTVARVTLVDTTTVNTDMRGTDNSLLASNYSAAPTVSDIADGVWDEAQSGHTTVGTFGYYLDSRVSQSGGGGGGNLTAADVWTYATRELTSGDNIVLDKGTGITGFNDIAATDIVTGGAINTTGGSVDNVTLVDTTTTNSDMRGTDNALLTASYTAPDNASITSILADTNELQTNQGNWLTATGFATTEPNNAGIATIIANTGTAIPNQISALNDISVDDVWTTQLTESYAADGVAPTATQAILMTQQFLTDFDITGVNYNVKRLDGTTAAGTFTLDDSANPTSITRSN